jgi:hypothetical protein
MIRPFKKPLSMKAKLIFLTLIAFSGILSAQDTIFVKNGKSIPATIIEKNNTEIKYKKFGQPEPAAIYSIFVIDISSIHYKDGIIADYTQAGQQNDNKPQTAIEMAGSMKSIRISFGIGAEYFNRNTSDDLLTFWRYYTGDNKAEIEGNSFSIPIKMRATFTLGSTGRNWIGDEVQVILMPKDAINAVNNGGASELKLGNTYINIILFYGHTLNHKRNLAAILEPGLDLAMSDGFIKLSNKTYEVSNNFGYGFHIATGADWVISRRFTADLRFGYRTMKILEMHKDSNSPNGYTIFYLPGTTEDLKVSWKGPYATLGLSWNFYAKLKGTIKH